MKSQLLFYNDSDRQVSDCGEPLVIEKSSASLHWEGIILEKGWSPYFFPTHIMTPYFYFALAREQELKWQAKNDGRLLDLKTMPGEIWFNPPWTAFTHHIEEPCFFIILAVMAERMYRAYPGRLPAAGLQLLNNYNLHDHSLENFIELFYHEVERNGANGLSYVDNLLTLFSEYFINNYSNLNALSRNQPASRIKPEHIDVIRRKILDNLETPCSIEELAAAIHMNKFYFLKEFKKATQLTPYQFQMQMRMEQAKTLLDDTQIDLVDAAVRLGFTDQSHFTRMFKKHFQQTPGEYRKTVRAGGASSK